MGEIERKATEELVKSLGDRIVAVALFGSRARGEGSDESDFDFFVVTEGDGETSRVRLYDRLYRVLRRDVTLVDVEARSVFKPDLKISPMLLNIAWESVLLHDPSNRLADLFNRIKEAVRRSGLVRYRTPDGKHGWKTKVGELKAIEV